MIKNITIKKFIIFTMSIVSIICIVFFLKNIVVDANGKSFGSVKLVIEYDENTTIDEMETVTFGSYPQSDITGNIKEPIEWIVLDRQGGRTLLLSKYILDCKCYNNITWENCDLRNWLNKDFYNQAFNGSEQNKIQMTNVINNDNSEYNTEGGNNTKDKVFCLSIDECKQYFHQFNMKSDNKRLATRGTNYAKNVDNNGIKLWIYDGSYGSEWATGNSNFWLRSPGGRQDFGEDFAADVDVSGYLDDYGYDVDNHYNGIRPALWVSD